MISFYIYGVQKHKEIGWFIPTLTLRHLAVSIHIVLSWCAQLMTRVHKVDRMYAIKEVMTGSYFYIEIYIVYIWVYSNTHEGNRRDRERDLGFHLHTTPLNHSQEAQIISKGYLHSCFPGGLSQVIEKRDWIEEQNSFPCQVSRTVQSISPIWLHRHTDFSDWTGKTSCRGWWCVIWIWSFIIVIFHSWRWLEEPQLHPQS